MLSIDIDFKCVIITLWPAVYSHFKKEWIAKQSAKPAL